jgi:hypothetical protein
MPRESSDPKPQGFFQLGRQWPWIIVGLLLIHASLIVGTIMVVSARNDLYVEPNYYAKAVDWDTQRATLEAADEMGWTIQLIVDQPTARADQLQTLRVAITDRENLPVTGALVEAECFHPAHANDRINTVLVRQDDGTYQAIVEMKEPGFWKINLSIRHRGIEAKVRKEFRIGT